MAELVQSSGPTKAEPVPDFAFVVGENGKQTQKMLLISLLLLCVDASCRVCASSAGRTAHKQGWLDSVLLITAVIYSRRDGAGAAAFFNIYLTLAGRPGTSAANNGSLGSPSLPAGLGMRYGERTKSWLDPGRIGYILIKRESIFI